MLSIPTWPLWFSNFLWILLMQLLHSCMWGPQFNHARRWKVLIISFPSNGEDTHRHGRMNDEMLTRACMLIVSLAWLIRPIWCCLQKRANLHISDVSFRSSPAPRACALPLSDCVSPRESSFWTSEFSAFLFSPESKINFSPTHDQKMVYLRPVLTEFTRFCYTV